MPEAFSPSKEAFHREGWKDGAYHRMDACNLYPRASNLAFALHLEP